MFAAKAIHTCNNKYVNVYTQIYIVKKDSIIATNWDQATFVARPRWSAAWSTKSPVPSAFVCFTSTGLSNKSRESFPKHKLH